MSEPQEIIIYRSKMEKEADEAVYEQSVNFISWLYENPLLAVTAVVVVIGVLIFCKKKGIMR